MNARRDVPIRFRRLFWNTSNGQAMEYLHSMLFQVCENQDDEQADIRHDMRGSEGQIHDHNNPEEGMGYALDDVLPATK